MITPSPPNKYSYSIFSSVKIFLYYGEHLQKQKVKKRFKYLSSYIFYRKMSEKENDLTENDDTSLLDSFTDDSIKVEEKKSSIVMDTLHEWKKGFNLINYIVGELGKDIRIVSKEDDHGQYRETHVNPELIKYLKERRYLLDQIWKLSGGELVQEGKKQAIKQMVDAFFNDDQENIVKDHKDDIKEVIETDVYEED